MFQVGSAIGPYILLRFLGNGGYGQVWLAEKRGKLATTQVAVKLPLRDQYNLEALTQEAQLWAKVSSGHPNIHSIIEAEIYDGQAVIVSEYAPDGSLEDWLKRHNGKATDWQQAVRLTNGILSGLAHLQRHNVVHRDVKPNNILMQQETPRLTDFGLARVLSVSSNTSMALGTPYYMSPEAFSGKRSFQSDVWAAGVVLYQLLSGEFPFKGKEANDGFAIMCAVRDLPLPPLGNHIPDPVQSVVTKALKKDPSDRYESAMAMQTALEHALSNFQSSVPATKINPKDGAVMIRIPAGEFLMGDDDDAIQDYTLKVRNNPRHKVTLSGYWIYKDLVTVGMYKKFCQATGKKMPPEPEYPAGNHFNPKWSIEDHPIVNVSWDDAMAYCTWAGVTLPTEAQWEKAARGTEGRKYPWGDVFDASKLWCSKKAYGDSGGTTRVGSYGVSPYGCTDMAGNVWQWCADYYDAGFWSSSAAKVTDPVNQGVGEKKHRVLRGGSWDDYSADGLRASFRFRFIPDSWFVYYGFRGVAAGL